MNILITAGGTSEKIDDVRHLTNHATGSLGKEIANSLLVEENIAIYYVHGPKAMLPANNHIKFFPIHSVRELEAQMKALLTTIPFHFVVHSMAVSDYELESTSNEELLAKEIAQTLMTKKLDTQIEIEEAVKEILLTPPNNSQPKERKISSQHEKLILVMKKAPKVITQIKQIQPDTKLIGFKLLVDVTEEKLVSVAQRSLETNQADFILANDLTKIEGDNHQGLLVTKTGINERFYTKKEIANGLKKLIITNQRKDVL